MFIRHEAFEQTENITCDLGAQPNSFGIVRLELDNRPIGLLWATRSDQRQYTETDLICWNAWPTRW